MILESSSISQLCFLDHTLHFSSLWRSLNVHIVWQWEKLTIFWTTVFWTAVVTLPPTPLLKVSLFSQIFKVHTAPSILWSGSTFARLTLGSFLTLATLCITTGDIRNTLPADSYGEASCPNSCTLAPRPRCLHQPLRVNLSFPNNPQHPSLCQHPLPATQAHKLSL